MHRGWWYNLLMLHERSSWRQSPAWGIVRRAVVSVLALSALLLVGGFIQARVQRSAWDKMLDGGNPPYIRYSPDFKVIASDSLGDGVQLWNASNKTLIDDVAEGSLGTQLEFDQQGYDFAWSYSNYAFFYGLGSNRLRGKPITAKSWIYAMAVSPDQYGMIATGSSAIELWGQPSPDLSHHEVIDLGFEDAVRDLAFSADSTLLAAGLSGNRVNVWRVITPGIPTEFKTEQQFAMKLDSPGVIRQVAFASDSQLLAVLKEKHVVLLRVADGEVLKEWELPGYAYQLAISPDSKVVVVAHAEPYVLSDKANAPSLVSAWSADTGEAIWNSNSIPSVIADISIADDNKTITAGYYDGEVRTYKLP